MGGRVYIRRKDKVSEGSSPGGLQDFEYLNQELQITHLKDHVKGRKCENMGREYKCDRDLECTNLNILSAVISGKERRKQTFLLTFRIDLSQISRG